MNYPVWELFYAGGGLLIAVIAVVHVYVSHFAVGGGLFLVLTEMKGYRENAPAIIRYTQRHSKFFLLLTMVFGAVTGVGIWFTIALLSPQATSALIHIFVFAFAAEWVCFFCEIVALFIYYHRFGKMAPKDHLKIGWLYFCFAWCSLFFINAIISFMLTPGDWLSTHAFWDGFFNPSMWPSLFFRTALSLVLCGLFGFSTAVFIRDKACRETMIRYCAKWVLFPFAFMLLCAYWYAASLPEAPRAMILGRSPEIRYLVKVLAWVLPALFTGALIMAVRVPGALKKPLAFVLLAVGLIYMGAFEWTREAGRRPYLIYNHLFSNAVEIHDVDRLNEQGLLKSAKWVRHRRITRENARQAGREMFRLQCAACHSVGGPFLDILPLTRKYPLMGMDAQLNGQGKINAYMPPFVGTRPERMALAEYIVEGLHGKRETPRSIVPQTHPVSVPPFDPAKDEYVLLPWSNFGMVALSDGDAYWSLRPPGSDLFAQLIRRGETPEIVTRDVVLYYALAPGFENPSRHVSFWEHAHSLSGKALPSDSGPSGTMELVEDQMMFAAHRLPLVPYRDDGTVNPYPVVTITATDKKTHRVLARTRTVIPVSTEMGCKHCHGGKWRVQGITGLSDRTARDVLEVHDKHSRTGLLHRAENEHPVSCQSCHAETALNSGENRALLNLSAAIHGYHANFLTDRGAEACHTCHPSSPEGPTRFFRGVHHDMGLDCTSCHGKMEDLALSLLAAEKAAGKPGAERLMKHLLPRGVDAIQQVKPRAPWINQPHCGHCHVDFQPPETDEIPINLRTQNRAQLFSVQSDDAGIMCQACHGGTHAVYPARNPYGEKLDNIPPLQHQKNPYPLGADKNCAVCHTVEMEDPVHHPNMLALFRNTW